MQRRISSLTVSIWRAGLDDMEKLQFLTLQGLELLPLSRPCSIITSKSLSILVEIQRYQNDEVASRVKKPVQSSN
jgi:hypothetical protein